MTRPVTDHFETRSNLEIRMMNAATGAILSRTLGVPLERSRTQTVYSVDVRHDHHGEGECSGKLIADDNRLRFESVTQTSHSQSWNYNQLEKFETERDHALLRVTPYP